MAKTVGYEKLTRKQKKLLDAAEEAMKNAYSPYSGFSVGAAVRTVDGTIITGANVENAVYGESVCAERAAILRANAMGHRMHEAMAIISKGRDFDTKTVNGPCGPCRQVLYEFSQLSGIDIEVMLSTTKKDRVLISTINELLPFPFGPKKLGIGVAKYGK